MSLIDNPKAWATNPLDQQVLRVFLEGGGPSPTSKNDGGFRTNTLQQDIELVTGSGTAAPRRVRLAQFFGDIFEDAGDGFFRVTRPTAGILSLRFTVIKKTVNDAIFYAFIGKRRPASNVCDLLPPYTQKFITDTYVFGDPFPLIADAGDEFAIFVASGTLNRLALAFIQRNFTQENSNTPQVGESRPMWAFYKELTLGP